MTNGTTPKTITGLFTTWHDLSRKLAIGAFLPEAFDRMNNERIEVEDAIADTAPTTLEELALKCVVAGDQETETIPAAVLSLDAMKLLGIGGAIGAAAPQMAK